MNVGGLEIHLLEEGRGEPVLYLHGFADVHGSFAGLQPFHGALAESFRLVVPAHPGCADSSGMMDVDTVEDVVFHYVELLDALGFEEVNLVGSCFGGWIAAELAVRYPERIRRLALIGATGLHVPGSPIADLFMLSLSRDGGKHDDVRHLLFGESESPLARELFPDGRASVEDELLRYKTLTFAGRIGWHPPYLYDPKLRSRLRRIICPALILWGGQDHMVPLAHGHAYAEGIRQSTLHVLEGAGHSPHLELPEEAARLLRDFLS